ncbi:chaperonin 10-like protein [Cristinia sonorae]|uniref:Chaperonin 10-like protein n=1 Tax=Cristinia sonorae TaxID=1940300 RepID=A0A8K0UDP8_9AGAR|nr:chaperonin 10-like protein [Cristinia sonorae]
MSVPSLQKALFVQERRGPWQISSAAVPSPGPKEVLIRVEAAGLNPVDWKIQKYGVAVDEYPAILGTDCAGVVVEIGEDVTRVKVGDSVLHQGQYLNRGATFQQYTVAHSDLIAKIPHNLSFDQAASVPVALSAAAFGLYGPKVNQGGAALTAPWKKGGRGQYVDQPIVIFGGASSVGQYVIQLAKISGFSPIITTVSPHSNDLVTSLGATHPIDRSLPPSSIHSTITTITAQRPVIAAFDAVCTPETQQTGYDILAPCGTLVLVLHDGVKSKDEGSGKTVISTLASVHCDTNREIGEEFYTHLEGLLESGDVKPNQVEKVEGGLRGVPEAFERMKNNLVSGRKLVVRPQETA